MVAEPVTMTCAMNAVAKDISPWSRMPPMDRESEPAEDWTADDFPPPMCVCHHEPMHWMPLSLLGSPARWSCRVPSNPPNIQVVRND